MGLMAATLLSASLVHMPIAGTSLHLSLLGLAGIVLGRRAFPALFVALTLQALLFGHGGLVSLGLNTLNMGAGALAGAAVWQWKELSERCRAFVAGFLGIMIPALLMAGQFQASGYGRGTFVIVALYLVAASVEGLLTVSVVTFFRRVGSTVLEPAR